MEKYIKSVVADVWNMVRWLLMLGREHVHTLILRFRADCLQGSRNSHTAIKPRFHIPELSSTLVLGFSSEPSGASEQFCEGESA